MLKSTFSTLRSPLIHLCTKLAFSSNPGNVNRTCLLWSLRKLSITNSGHSLRRSGFIPSANAVEAVVFDDGNDDDDDDDVLHASFKDRFGERRTSNATEGGGDVAS